MTHQHEYRNTFRKPHTLLVAVPVEELEQILRDVRIARDEGADGVFLINYRIPTSLLTEYYNEVRRHCPGFWVGMNCLGLSRANTLDVLPDDIDGFFIDNAGIREDAADPAKFARDFANERERQGVRGLYFGGVPFAGNPARAANLAVPYVDVIMAGGDGSNVAPEVETVCYMKQAVGNYPLAVTSGNLTLKNVAKYKPYTDCFVVPMNGMDPRKIRELAQAIAS